MFTSVVSCLSYNVHEVVWYESVTQPKCTGKSIKSWKRRWFVLKSNGYLYYYENKASSTEKGKIDVMAATRVGECGEISSANRKVPSGFMSSNAFAIVVKDRTFTCVCENDGDSQLSPCMGISSLVPRPLKKENCIHTVCACANFQ